MPMGDLNAAPIFLSMMMNIQTEWDTLHKKPGLKHYSSKIIVDYLLLYIRTSNQRLAYFRTVLDILKHHRATIKLKIKMVSRHV